MSAHTGRNNLNSFVICGGLKGCGPNSVGLGAFVAKELLKIPGVQLKVLVRSSASANSDDGLELKSLGATIVEVEYETKDPSLITAITGADVVMCFFGINPESEHTSQALARVSKDQGVKLFVPSEYGWDNVVPDGTYPPYIWSKRRLELFLENDAKLPYATIANGGLAELCPFFLSPSRPIKIVGTGDEPLSWTSCVDIGRFVAFVLTMLPIASLANRRFAIEGARYSLNAMITAYEAKHDTKLTVTYEPAEEAVRKWKEEGDFLAYLGHQWAIGNGAVVVGDREVDNGLYPDWNPKDLTEFM